ncbi:peptidoglycan-binding protein [Yoonia sediminilitoris]|uniref:OmpA family protein n=1 Tax=Yoonia sediminilitoris TaxID=1286148 RepID=A0A2T6KC45_9RHOB|nr:peptidoglycan-binding protein [Yoonia sediminilitoris]PUB12416.1 OmpA family protein [Yoonia sediminilitoris]RCW93110.1 OmpA family protein [Yoonia sediminilitoris]
MTQPIRPILGELELQQVQLIQLDEDQVLTRHDIAGLEGDFFQRLGRAGAAIELSGIQSGTDARQALNGLRDAFRAAAPLTFAADIVSATDLDDVLIEQFEIAEHAGQPDCYAYRMRLREYTQAPEPEPETPTEPPVEPPVSEDEGVLVVRVIKEGDPGFDASVVDVVVNGTTQDGGAINDRALTNRDGNLWTENPFPVGSFTVLATAPGAAADGSDLSGTATADVRAGETTEVEIVLRDDAALALRFIVHFRFDSAFVEPCLLRVLRQVADYSAENADLRLVTVGHTDLAGPTPYNQSLSERRARSVFAVLRFANDPAAAVAEWETLRQTRTPGTNLSLHDTWGTREYQQMLQERRHYQGRIDGNHGPLTEAAVRAFQNASGLPETGAMNGATWPVLIRAYLAGENLTIPDDRLLPNCPGERLLWLGCGELDPVRDVQTAWRPNRRTELLFTRATELPADVAQPDTFNLPTTGAVAGGWCVNDSNTTARSCFVVPNPNSARHETCPGTLPRGAPLTRQPAEPSPQFIVQGSIRYADGRAYEGEFFVTAPDGEYLPGEVPTGSGSIRAGTPRRARTQADGTFSFPTDPDTGQPRLKGPGIYILELDADVVARPLGAPLEEAKGPVVCTRLAAASDRFDVIIVSREVAQFVPDITAPAAVVVRRPHTNPARQPVVLRVNAAFTGTGTFTISQGAGHINVFDAPAAGNQLAFNGTDNVFTSDQLLAGHTVYLEGGPTPSTRAGDVELALQLDVNGEQGFTDRAQLTAVRLTLDIAENRRLPMADPPVLSEADKADPGRILQVQNDRNNARRALVLVRRAEPADFTGNLVLRELNPAAGRLRLFGREDETPVDGQTALTPPLTFANATIPQTAAALMEAGLRFFAEGAQISAGARDAGFQLGLEGIEPDGDRVAVTAVQYDFITQANAAFPFSGDDACMMVSKAVTNVNLPDTATFDGPPGASPDPDTFRMQITGLPAGQPLQLQLETLRGGVQQTDHTFAIVEGVVGTGPAYRANEHVRLVSNAVDDAHRAHQTVLVRLEDLVRATAVLNGTEIARIDLPVGRPPAETGPKAVRTCDIHFVTLTGTNSDPARTIDRMSEDWAQLAIRFNLLSRETVTPVANVLTVTGTATAAGNITFNMTNAAGTTAAVTVPIVAGDNNQTIATKIATQISTHAGFAATEHRHQAQRIVLVNPRQNVDFDSIVSPAAAVVVQEPALNFADAINLLEGSVLGLNFNDGVANSIDLIAIGRINIQLAPGAAILAGATGGDYLANNLPGWQNLIIIQEQAVDTSDADMPYIAGHEVGHALFDGGDPIHHPTATNLFHAGPSPAVDTIGGSKRLDGPQNTRARARSGHTTVPPLLQQR